MASQPDIAPPPRDHNRPPLEESIIMDFDQALRENHPGLLERIDKMETQAAAAQPCTTADAAGRMGDFIKMAGAAAKAIEAERELLNRPLLNAQRGLKARADNYAARANAAGAKVRVILDVYLAAEEKKRRAEAARIAEENRLAEEKRQAAIREEQRKAAEAAEAERKRLQDIEDARVAAERKRLQAIEDERAAAEAREVKVVEVEAAVIEVEPEPVHIPEPEPEYVATAPAKSPVRGDYGASVSTVEHWDVKVVNIRAVPDAYLKHPTVVEALEKVIRPLVRGKNGLRELKGCEITSTLGSAVR